jgi:hypothetical protein
MEEFLLRLYTDRSKRIAIYILSFVDAPETIMASLL